jgi:ElaB/YqjD/DUF883 family membrane-anchored ribosome-binding protein
MNSMSTTKKSSKKFDVKKTEEMARKIWLAGLGAYGQGFDNLQEGYEKMNDQSRKMFDELVIRGEKIEADTKGLINETGEKIKSQGKKLKSQQVESMEKLNSRMIELRGKVAPPEFVTEQIEDIRARLNELSESMSSLLSFNRKEAAAKPAAKKPAVKKPAAKKPATRKAPAKKAPATPAAE